MMNDQATNQEFDETPDNPYESPSSKSHMPENGDNESLRSNATLAFVLPLVASLLITNFYPKFAASYEGDGWGTETAESAVSVTSETWLYLGMVTVQVVLIFGLIGYFWRVYLRHFPFKVSWLSVVVGVIGVVLWILLTGVGIEDQLLDSLGFDMSRASFNPFVIKNSAALVGFFAVRFTLLTLANPIAEELFIRGWLVRWVHNPQFENVTFKELSILALFAASIYGVMTHPTEAIAAFVWFGLVTLLMRYTGSIWDCIVAHAVTNFLLGVYVVYYQEWHLW